MMPYASHDIAADRSPRERTRSRFSLAGAGAASSSESRYDGRFHSQVKCGPVHDRQGSGESDRDGRVWFPANQL
jgi:hypothetical protein